MWAQERTNVAWQSETAPFFSHERNGLRAINGNPTGIGVQFEDREMEFWNPEGNGTGQGRLPSIRRAVLLAAPGLMGVIILNDVDDAPPGSWRA